jgi:hypothetical protein
MLDGAEETDLRGNVLSATDSRIVSHSGKMTVLHKLIQKLLAEGHRILLFSQFTTMLDILEDYVSWAGYRYARLDGSVSRFRRGVDIIEVNAPLAAVRACCHWAAAARACQHPLSTRRTSEYPRVFGFCLRVRAACECERCAVQQAQVES